MSSVLSTGSSALIAFQRALATVSHNVANIKTDGYSRQKVDFATRNPTDVGYGDVGNGTRITDIRRVVRWSNVAPRLRSSSASRSLTTDFESRSVRAASLIEPASATATKLAMPSSFIVRIFRKIGSLQAF